VGAALAGLAAVLAFAAFVVILIVRAEKNANADQRIKIYKE
jgi:hypothetical protein